jgi:hypothetical protein
MILNQIQFKFHYIFVGDRGSKNPSPSFEHLSLLIIPVPNALIYLLYRRVAGPASQKQAPSVPEKIPCVPGYLSLWGPVCL